MFRLKTKNHEIVFTVLKNYFFIWLGARNISMKIRKYIYLLLAWTVRLTLTFYFLTFSKKKKKYFFSALKILRSRLQRMYPQIYKIRRYYYNGISEINNYENYNLKRCVDLSGEKKERVTFEAKYYDHPCNLFWEAFVDSLYTAKTWPLQQFYFNNPLYFSISTLYPLRGRWIYTLTSDYLLL